MNFAVSPVVLEQGVDGSLPLAEEFTVPVFTAFHQEQFSAGETIENISVFPVVQEQVLVQAVPRVVGSLPPVHEFTGPVAQVHQEQLSASVMTENIVDFPVVHEQVIVGMRPERLVDARGPHGGLERAACPRSEAGPLLVPPVVGGGTPWTTPPSRSYWRSRCSSVRSCRRWWPRRRGGRR